MNAITDPTGLPLKQFMTGGQVGDHTGCTCMLDSLPAAKWMNARWVHNAERIGYPLKDNGVRPCIYVRESRSKAVRYEKWRNSRHNRMEIMCGRLKDWRGVATHSDRCTETFLSVVVLATIVNLCV